MNEKLKEEYKTIIEFMGTKEEMFLYHYRLDKESKIDLIRFKSDYNMVFPIVDKIENIESQRLGGFVVRNEGTTTTIYSKNKTKKDSINIMYIGDTKIESIYYACLKFIEWYNKNSI